MAGAIARTRDNNAIAQANAPNWRRLLATCPHTLVQTHGEFVGLPDGQMGNSEVGHMNIGAGRIVYQDLTRIDAAIADGSFFHNPALLGACAAAKRAAQAGDAACVRAAQSRRRAQQRRTYLRFPRSGAEERRRTRGRACLPRRPRHAAAECARFAGEIAGAIALRSATRTSPRSADATTRWIATSAGSA